VKDSIELGGVPRGVQRVSMGMARSGFLLGLLLAVCGPSVVRGQAPTAPATPPPAVVSKPRESEARPEHPLLRSVVFVGASATAGFGVVLPDPDKKERSVTLPLAASFAGAVTEIATETGPRTFGSGLFFLSPVVTGGAQVDRALELKPTLVVAVDFLFWYGYGNDNGKGGRVERESERLEKLELGFRQLERFGTEIPIVVGDFPNMERAVGKMISRDQMPEQETLRQLNERFHAWAKERPNVILFPLAELVEALKSEEVVEIAGQRFEKSKGRLIQSDDLHPTARGSIALGLRIAEALNAWMQSTPADEKPLSLAADELSATQRAHAAAQAILARRAGTLPTPRTSGGGSTPSDAPQATPPGSR
jgi:hypothetical protein